jgi:hypothetical protein
MLRPDRELDLDRDLDRDGGRSDAADTADVDDDEDDIRFESKERKSLLPRHPSLYPRRLACVTVVRMPVVSPA